MLAFDDIKPGSRLRGLDAAGIAEVVQVSRFGADALNLVFRVHGRVTERLVYRGEETSFELVEAGRAYAGDQLAIFGEALRELTERATYLYEESGRYWFSTQPTLNRLAEDRAKALPDHEVDAAIAQILRDDATHHRGGFHRVFAAHDDPITVDEAQALSLRRNRPREVGAGRLGTPPETAVARGQTAFRLVRRLCLSAQAPRPGGARDRYPRCRCQTRSGFRICRWIRQATDSYTGLVVAKSAPVMLAPSAVVVRADVAFEQTKKTGTPRGASPADGGDGGVGTGPRTGDEPATAQQPRRFYGSVEIDMVRPVKAFDAILNAVVMELQRNPSTKVKITLEIEAETSSGFSEADIGVVRDNARQLKFKAESTGFE